MKIEIQQKFKTFYNMPFQAIVLLLLITSCSDISANWENLNEEGSFLLFRRQSLIGEEHYSLVSNGDTLIITSMQGENERGRITGMNAEMRMKTDLTPLFYENRFVTPNDTLNKLKVVSQPDEILVWEEHFDLETKLAGKYFPVHSDIPAAMEMMMYHYYFAHGKGQPLTTYPRGQMTIEFRKKETVEINGEQIILDRYKVKGINWGFHTIWLDKDKNLVAIVKANTQFREVIKKGYEDALKTFVNGHVEEEMAALSEYTYRAKGIISKTVALVGGNLIDGISDSTKLDMTVIIQNGKIKKIGSRADIEIPEGANVIDVSGKVLMPGLWDMHAHANQVQWSPAYLAGGVTTFRDLGNEVEFATAYRDAVNKNDLLGPHILLGGMTDGPGEKGNGAIRATTTEQAKEVVKMYKTNGYDQIKIYNSVKADILKVLTEEAHNYGMTVTGHVPVDVGNAISAVESGMDQLNHATRILSVLFPDKDLSELEGNFLLEDEISDEQIESATKFFLENKTVLDPTISVYIKRSLASSIPVETIIPNVGNIAYELWEGKRFQRGLNKERSETSLENLYKAMEIIGHFYKAGVPIVAGTDNAVPVYCLYYEIEAYSKLGKLTPFEAIQCATIVPAKVMGLDKVTGTLEVGKEADIAILDKNPLDAIENIGTVTAVVNNGTYYQSEILWELANFGKENYKRYEKQ